MSAFLNAEQEYLKDTVRKYLANNLKEQEKIRYEKDRIFPFELLKDLMPFGMIGGLLTEANGGHDLDFTTWTLLVEEAGYHWGSLRAAINNISMVSLILEEHGSKEQKAQYLQPVMRCESRGWIGISEPNVGSNVAGVETRAKKAGEDYLITGTKLWITFGLWSDFGILLAKTYSAQCDGGLSLFLVDRQQTDFAAEPVETMILKSTGTAQLMFENARIPASALIGEEGQGLKVILTALNKGRLNVAAGSVGYAQAALDKSVDYVQVRKQFGKTIAEFQLVQKTVVDMQVRTTAARAVTYSAARELDQGKLARKECSIAKLYATQAGFEVADMAINVHGGIGYAIETGLERIFRDAKGAIIPEGTADVQRLIIGRELLGVSAIN